MLKYVSVVYICHHQADDGYTKRNIKGKRPLFNVLLIITILFQKRNNMVQTKTQACYRIF
jgi:hypothetical protein